MKWLEALLTKIAKRLDSRVLGTIAIGVSQMRGSASRPRYMFRKMVDLLQPKNPLALSDGAGVPIDVVTITAPDTFDFAETSLKAAMASSGNPVRKVFAIVPDDAVEEATRVIPSATILTDSEVLPPAILNALTHFSDVGRDKWVLCQVLGMYFARNSDAAGVLIVDADTYLLQERTWLDSAGNQILSFSYEYHKPYEEHCERLYGPRKRHFGLSYVTHYMLMQPSILQEIFPDDDSFIRWVREGNPDQKSAVADYHTYGRWLVDNHPQRAKLARWDNNRFVWPFQPGVTTNEALHIVSESNRGFLSASSHRYLER